LAAFPTLASHYVKKELGALIECLSLGLRHIIFWSLPVTALFIVLRAHIVRVILGSGAFDWADTRITAAALALFVISIVFQSVQLFLTRAHYAFGRTRLPLLVNLVAATSTILLGLGFNKYFTPDGAVLVMIAKYLKVEGLLRVSVLGLPLAYSAGALLSAFLLWHFLEKEIKTSIRLDILRAFRDSFLIALGVGAVVSFALHIFDNVFSLEQTFGVLLHALISGILGIAVGVGVMYLFKNKEFNEILAKLK